MVPLSLLFIISPTALFRESIELPLHCFVVAHCPAQPQRSSHKMPPFRPIPPTPLPRPFSNSSPRAAPTPPSSRSSPSPQGFIVPRVPPPNCPLHVTAGPDGPELPRVSDSPLAVDDERVTRLIKFRLTPGAKCRHCHTMHLECDFSESGLPCPSCAVLGMSDCDFTDADYFLLNIADRRDQRFHDERRSLVAAVRENRLSPSLFDREYERSCAWFYSEAQGAITRFLLNCRATHNLAIRGYHTLAAASDDTGLLSRLLALGVEFNLHPSVLHILTERLQTVVLERIGQ
ncbi:hypothetical protein DFH08DRAFT_842065 [Mycena albidolilacea]|uniref:Zn(2)-C6 fungal-type domain-containing protein n=1 Tax=Mycena albidolilacea TaxID=1033008 RepID=A0AAD7AJA7_9AGAR|nr:hypothetical protein DFH08DRAFT_842065 [Mycena albidolilacea]